MTEFSIAYVVAFPRRSWAWLYLTANRDYTSNIREAAVFQTDNRFLESVTEDPSAYVWHPVLVKEYR